MKPSVVVSCSLVSVLASTSTWAQSVDFLDQDVRVDVAADPLHVEVALHVQATGRSEEVAIFVPSIPLVSLEVDGEPLETTPDPTYPDYVLWAAWPEPLEEGDEAVVRMVLDGEPTCTSPFAQGAVCTRRPDETMLVPSSVAMAWAFTNLFESDPFTATIEVRAPADHLVAAGQGAARVIVDGEDGTRTWRFAADVPTEQLAVYTRVAGSVRAEGALPVVGVAPDDPDRLATMEQIATIAAEVLPAHAARYGDLGLDEFHLLTFSDRTAFGGMGLFGNVLLFESILDEPYEYLREQGVAHETAHSWWGGLASAASWEEGGFFNEAFAEYSAWAALGALRGDAVRTSGARMSAVWYMLRRPADEDIAVLDPAVADSPVYVFVTYHKASVILRTLEEGAGAEAFARALARFVARGTGGLSTEALAEDVLAESGWDPTAAMDQWLWTTGFPTVTAALGADDTTLALDVEGDFSFGLPAVVQRADGTRDELVLEIGPGASEAALPEGAPPIRVELDPRWTLVRLVRPSVPGDVSLDGVVDAIDLVDVALRQGGALPDERRHDGAYDPLYDVDEDERIDRADLDAVVESSRR